MMTSKTLLRQAFFAALLLLGCATADQQLIDPPVVEYLGMEMKTNGLFDANPIFKFHIENPNPFGITVKEITYSLYVNDRKFVKGVSGQNIRILAGESGDGALFIFFSFLDLYELSSLHENAETIRYDLSGHVRVGPFAVPYHTAGRFDVPQPPIIDLTGARSEITETGNSVLLLDIRIHNPNPAAAVLNGIDYRVMVNEKEEFGGRLNGPISLDPGTDTPLVLSAATFGETVHQDGGNPFEGTDMMIDLSGDMIFASEKRPPQRLPFRVSERHDIRP